MDAKRFDTIAKALICETNRRRTLSGLLGAALGCLGFADVEAKKSKKNNTGGQGAGAEGGNCKPACGTCEQCRKGKCHKTGSGKKKCKKGTCKPLTGTTCTTTTGGTGTCQAGSCVSGGGGGCTGGSTSCGGVCTDLQTDEANCGTCGTACGAGQTCCDGVCTNLQTDEASCGSCGFTCFLGQTCCSGACRSTQTDEANCGTCGHLCVAPAVICLAGDCCRPPTLACAAAGADPTCCSGACLPAGVGGIPFPHCA